MLNSEEASEGWVVVGASRGIGLEFVRQLLDRGHYVIAAVRCLSNAEQLRKLISSQSQPENCDIEVCDFNDEESIENFTRKLGVTIQSGKKINNVILNGGINKYPNRAVEMSYNNFASHIYTNTIGPIICAQRILSCTAELSSLKLIFISSDSGSATLFRKEEDGFAGYSASKAALNQTIRHMAAEVSRWKDPKRKICILAMHPGEVQTDMSNIDLDWEVSGVIQPSESVNGMLRVIRDKTEEDNGTFWCWNGVAHPW